jgi:hypothetical protein
MSSISKFVVRAFSRAGSFHFIQRPSIARCGLIPILLLLMGLSSTGRADTFGDFTYTTDDVSATITKYTGPGGNVIIPDAIEGKPVTFVGYRAFSGCVGLTGIIIPNSVTGLSAEVFSDCSGLTNVTMPEGIGDLNSKTFFGCKSLTDITIPNSVTSVGESSFFNCTSLTNVTLPITLNIISPQLFYGCAKLSFITIPNGVTAIGGNAFHGCASLSGVTIPASVTQLGVGVFSECTSLAAITVDSLNTVYSSIDGVMFNKNLTTLIQYPEARIGDYTVSNSVTSIGDYAFAGCVGLTSFVLPGGVTAIGIGSFSDCVRLSNIEIPANILKIRDRAFSGCAAVTNITIGAGTTNIGVLAFFDCNSLMNITVDPLNTAFSSVDGVLFNKNQSLLIHCSGARFENYMVPKSVKTVQESAFADCSRLTAITVDPLNTAFYTIDGALYLTSLTNLVACPGGKSGSFSIAEKTACILSFAFSGCSRLTNINFPISVFSIGSNAFLNCTGLTSIAIPPGCRYITDFEFSGCTSLKSVVIPSTTTYIFVSAFNNCTSLSGVYFQGDRPPFRAGSSIQQSFDSTLHATVYYRIGTGGWDTSFCGWPTAPWVDSEASDFVWKLTNQSMAITNYNGSGGNATIPATIFGYAVISIGDSAFAGQTNLTSISIPGSVTNLGASAFADCTHLMTVFFNGNAPTVSGNGDPFTNATNVIVYYRAGTTGWGSTFAGRPTALWIEQPSYQEWATTTGLTAKFPDASAETDDADHDGMTNLAEMQAGTDPTNPNSKLAFESIPRPNDLEDADKTPAGSDQLALYFQTVPGKQYMVQRVNAFGGLWQTETNMTASTTQKQVLVNKPTDQGFYRVVLVP